MKATTALVAFKGTCLGAAIGVAVASVAVAGTAGTQHTPRVPRTDPVAAMVAAHGCWSGPAPVDMAGKVPGHVVVTLPGNKAPTYGGHYAVERALDQLFNGVDAGYEVHAFCR